ISALRVPYLNPNGQHGFGLYEPDRLWDGPTYMAMLLGHYFETSGQELIDTPCDATASCDFIPPPLLDPSQLPVPNGTPTGGRRPAEPDMPDARAILPGDAGEAVHRLSGGIDDLQRRRASAGDRDRRGRDRQQRRVDRDRRERRALRVGEVGAVDVGHEEVGIE